jgi:glyoxylase-like metal-dependent hydrolase (beta-lactamase superfamily II)
VKSSRHGDHLVKLTRLGSVNAYLVREDDGFTLVDTGLPGSADSIIDAASEAGGEIRRVAVTHAHGDHVGSLKALKDKLPGVEVLVPERDVRFLRGDRSLDPDEPQAKVKGSYPKVDVEPTRLLAAGDRTLVAGDAFQTLGGIAVAGKIKPLFPLPALGTWHKPTAVASARKLRELDPSRLAVGHGRVIESPGRDMDAAISDAS